MKIKVVVRRGSTAPKALLEGSTLGAGVNHAAAHFPTTGAKKNS